ncbi:transposase, partial [Streptomyces sp. NPDC015032]|uniref:transposase n=1 Tax=Streptomyces sp. NPDC015032 TaxID=3364937 RepID=UPI0036FC0240
MPELTAQVARAVAARGPYPLAMRVRDELGELFSDAEFAEAFEAGGRPGWSPGRLALVTVLQFAENLTDRAAAHRGRYGMDLKYALGLELDDPGFDASVLSEFRTRLVEHGMEEKVLDLLLTALRDRGLVKVGGKQRTDSPRVPAAVRDLNRLEPAGETRTRSTVPAPATLPASTPPSPRDQVKPAGSGWVGPGRGTGLATSPFPRPARRTRRACLHAT